MADDENDPAEPSKPVSLPFQKPLAYIVSGRHGSTMPSFEQINLMLNGGFRAPVPMIAGAGPLFERHRGICF